MKRYPAYKDSGVEWIGEIPEDWEPKKLKYLAKVRLSNIDKKSEEGESPVRLCNYVDVYYNEKITSNIEFMEATAPKEKINDFSLRRGDVLITKDSETPDDIAVPTYVPASLPGVVCGYHLALIRPNGGYADGNYLFRSFIAHGIRDQFEISANGITRFGIGKYAIEDSLFLCPPLEDQVKISKYLDHKTHLIDTLIEKKQKQIELLQEQRAAIINQAVTKGLNPNVKMKDSGIEWLGEVPAHWTILMLGKMATLQRGHDLPGRLRKEGTFPVVSSSGISGYHSEPKVNGPGVITGRYGTIGKPFYIEIDFWPLNTTLYVKNFHGNLPKFVFYMLHYIPYDIDAGKSAVPGVNRNALHSLHSVRPPIEEQKEIVKHIEKMTKMVNMTIKKVQKQIGKLQEYRTTLISEVVTGKIDVRDEVIP